MELRTCSDGEVLDLHSVEGTYQYVGKFLNKHAAPSDVWACFGKLHQDPTRVSVDNKRLKRVIARVKCRTNWVNCPLYDSCDDDHGYGSSRCSSLLLEYLTENKE